MTSITPVTAILAQADNAHGAGNTPVSIRSTQGSVARMPTAFEKEGLSGGGLHDTAMRHGLHDTMDVSLDGTRFTDMAGELDTMDGMASVFSETSSEGLGRQARIGL